MPADILGFAPPIHQPVQRRRSSGKLIWALSRDAESLLAELHDDASGMGCDLVLRHNGIGFSWQRYLTGASALEDAAGARRRYEADGWR